MLYKLQNDGKNIAVSACYYRFSFFPVCSVKDIVATTSTVFQHLVFLACSGSLFPCDSDLLWLTLDLFLTLSGALWLTKFLLGSYVVAAWPQYISPCCEEYLLDLKQLELMDELLAAALSSTTTSSA